MIFNGLTLRVVRLFLCIFFYFSFLLILLFFTKKKKKSALKSIIKQALIKVAS
jgi:hypothetical protein